MKNRIHIFIIMLVSSMISHAQVDEYHFSQQTSTYVEIAGGTVLWSGTFNNEVSGEITIPSFTYNSTEYTSLYVSANGFITFGAAPTATNYTPISTTGAYTGAISGFGGNLNQAATGTPAVIFQQVGYEFIIQWKDVRREDIASEIISFQVRLNTSNNHIAVVYGGTITPGLNTSYPQVGLKGALATDYHNRTIAATGGNWVNSAEGAMSNDIMYFNSANPGTIPLAGLTYTWKPLYNPLNFTATAINMNQIDLAWQKNPLNCNVMLAFNTENTFGIPVSGQVYSDGNTIIGGGTVLFYGDGTSFSHTGLSASAVYYYKIWSYDAVPDYSKGLTDSTRTAYALPYLQSFPSTIMPAEWSGDMSRTADHGTSGSIGLDKRLTSTAITCNAIAPLVGSITSSTYLSFHYRIVNYLAYPLVATTLAPVDMIEIQVSTDDGASFTTIHTIDQNNHTATTEFTNKVLSLAAYNGDFIKIRFLCTWGSGDYYVDIDNVLFEDGTSMSYSTSTTEQLNTSLIGIGTSNNDILRLQVITQKSSSPIILTSVNVTVNGAADISTARIFYTTNPVFSTAVQYGNAINNPDGGFSFTGSQVLVQGNNYFWMAYDIKSTATAGNTVDGACQSFITSESGTAKVPGVLSPPGNRKLGALFTGVKSIPGDYATLVAAVTALNLGIVGSGGVTFNIAAGHTETASAAIILTATSTSANPIIFQKSGEGTNPLITAYVGISGTSDAIIKIAGGDYITFDRIDIVDPASNTNNAQRMEWGYALVKAQNTAPFNGCQHVTIKNCNITLQKAYTNSVGIYAGNHISGSTTQLTILLPTDAMNNCRFYNNTISNVYTGIKLSGFDDAAPYSLYNHGNEIGVSGGNTISNFGGAGSTAYGIYAIYESGIKVVNNSITGGAGTTNTLYGIFLSTATSANADIYENDVTLSGGGTTNALTGINNSSGNTAAGNTVNIYNNTVTNCTFSTATTGDFTAIKNSATATTVNIHGNFISNNSMAGTGTFTGINGGAPSNLNIFQNNINGNTVQNGSVHGIYEDLGTNVRIYKNDIYDLSSSSTSSLEGIVNGILIGGGTNVYVYNNFISDLGTPSASNADAIRGISITSTQINSTIGVYYNTIYLDATSSGTNFGTSGIYHTSSATATTSALDLRNNIIVNKSLPNGTAYTSAFRRSEATLGNCKTVSNNNIFYAGIPGTYNVIYSDGSPKQTIEEYRTHVGPSRDSLSFSENPVFVNVNTTPYNLRLQDVNITYCENGAKPMSTPVAITDDFDGAARPSTPDIGADEFSGIPAYIHPLSTFSAVCAGQSQINLSWMKNANNQDIMVTSQASAFSGNPVNGTEYNVGDAISSAGTVIYMGPASAFNHIDLSNWSQHFYKAWSFSNYNYYSVGVIANAITDADTIETLPYFQDFGQAWVHSPAAPDQWKVVNAGGSDTPTWRREISYYYQAPACAEGSGNQDDYLVSPPVKLPDTDCRFVWWDKVENASDINTYRVMLSTTGSEPASFTASLDTFDCTNTAWTRHELDISPYKNQTVFLAFHQFYSATQYSNFAIDEVRMDDLPLGILFTQWQGTVSNEWSNTANWSDGVPGVNYDVIINNESFDPIITAAVTIYKITLSTGAVINISPTGSLNVTGN